ncbi:hypothetical protein FHG87_020368 [Trinorchestia longiramus]|nr:hypothetical protein FHG87_020368 [Trinorchestia longiramus]
METWLWLVSWLMWRISNRSGHRSGHDLLVRGCVPAWQGRDHCQRSGQQDNSFVRRLHGHRKAHRRSCQEPGRP